MRLLALYDDHTHSDRDDTEPLSAYDPHGHFCCKGATLPSLSHARRDVSISVSSLGPHHLGSLEVRCDTTEIQTLVFLSRGGNKESLTPAVSFQGLGVHTTLVKIPDAGQLQLMTF